MRFYYKLTFILALLILIGCSSLNKSYLLNKKEAESLRFKEYSVTRDLVDTETLYIDNINGHYYYDDDYYRSLSLQIYKFPSNENLERLYNGTYKTNEEYIKTYLISENKFGEKGWFYKFNSYKLFFVKNGYFVIINGYPDIPQETIEKVAVLTAEKFN